MSVLKYTINLNTIFYNDLEKQFPYMLNENTSLTLGMILYYRIIKEDLDKSYDDFLLCEKLRRSLIENKEVVLKESEMEALKNLMLKTSGISEDLKGQVLQYFIEEMGE